MKRSAAVICIFAALCISATSCGSKSDTPSETPFVTSQTTAAGTKISSEPVTSPVTSVTVPALSSESETDSFIEDIEDAAETAIDDAKEFVTDMIEQLP